MDASLREARLLDSQGRTREAIGIYRAVLARRPGLPNAWYNLAVLERKVREFAAALASYQEALDRGVVRPEEVHLNRGVIYADHLRQDEAAERELQAALGLNENYVPALLNLANLHEDRGHRALALQVCERILAIDPGCQLALARYANLKSFTDRDDPLIARLRRAIAEPNAGFMERADLGFALGRALDSCGDHGAAFEAYEEANVHSRRAASSGYAYNHGLFEQFIDRLIAAFPVAERADARPSTPPHPIFICGMFRSGSTLTEQMVAGHPRVTAGGELDFIPHMAHHTLSPFPESMASAPPQRLRALAEQYAGTLADLFPGADLVTDKRPDNFLYLGLIKRLFPAAKIVHTVRDPLDNCLSVFFQHLDPSLAYAWDLLDTGHYYRQYRRLMSHWKALYGEDIIDVDYDALVRDPRTAIERLLAALDLEWDARCLTVAPTGRIIKTASVWQAREAVHLRSSGRSRHYSNQLAGLRRYLAT